MEEQELCRNLQTRLEAAFTYAQAEDRYTRLFTASAGIAATLLAAALLIVYRWPAPAFSCHEEIQPPLEQRRGEKEEARARMLRRLAALLFLPAVAVAVFGVREMTRTASSSRATAANLVLTGRLQRSFAEQSALLGELTETEVELPRARRTENADTAGGNGGGRRADRRTAGDGLYDG